jgi:hypothetical protein
MNRRRTNIREDAVASVEQQVFNKVDSSIIYAMRDHISTMDLNLYGRYSPYVCLLAYVAWTLFSWSYRKVEQQIGIPHSNVRQIFGTISRALVSWAETHVASTLQKRTTARNKTHPELAENADFMNTSMLMDGTQIRFAYQMEHEERDIYLSYKFKQNPAVNLIVATDLDSRVIFVSDGICLFLILTKKDHPGRRHDIWALKQCATDLSHIMSPQDVMLADAGFVGSQKIAAFQGKTILVPFRGDLDMTQKAFNETLSGIRSEIERTFGRIKGQFKVFKLFRGSPRRVARTFKICSAIHNLQLDLRDARAQSVVASRSNSQSDIQN